MEIGIFILGQTKNTRQWDIPGTGIGEAKKIHKKIKNSQKSPVPVIGDFLNPGDFIPGDRGFLSPGFLQNSWKLPRKCIILISQRFGIFLPGIFDHKVFFHGKGYPTKKPPLMVDSKNIPCYYCVCDPIPKNSIRRVFRKVS